MRSVAIHSTGQIFMVFYCTIFQNTHKMRKISNFHTFEILGHPSGWWVCKPSLVFSFGPKLNKTAQPYGVHFLGHIVVCTDFD